MKANLLIILCAFIVLFCGSNAQASSERSRIEQALAQFLGPNEDFIVVDMTTQTLWAQTTGSNFETDETDVITRLQAKCITGRVSDSGGDNRPTPLSVTEDKLSYTTVVEKDIDAYSNEFGGSMPYALKLGFTNRQGNLRGIAIHKGNLRMFPASHACIRLSEADAIALFNMTSKGTKVFTFGSALTYQKKNVDIDALVSYNSKGWPTFRAVLPNATQADKDLLEKYFREKKLEIDYLGTNGKGVSLDKNDIKFRYETMPRGSGITVAQFEKMYGYNIKLRPPTIVPKAIPVKD